jgi:hypothetical protein
MNSSDFLDVYVVHYTRLKKRKNYLVSVLAKQRVNPFWVTEKNYIDYKRETPIDGKILGVNEKLVGMDLGINSRSLTRSRRKARLEGYLLFFRSYLSRSNTHSTGSLPSRKVLGNAWLELQRMHLTALQLGAKSGSKWILILEDDAVPSANSFNTIEEIAQTMIARNTWINLNSGAGLSRTKSEKIMNKSGLFRVKPAATRCAVAYLVSHDLAVKILRSAVNDGIPDWLPIDNYLQVLLRKFKVKSYWIEPELFEQGSESGLFQSGFENLRK